MSVKHKVGIFFSINDKKFVTEIEYRSRKLFEKLIKTYTENVNLCSAKDEEKLTYISIENFLFSAYEHLSEKPRANKLLINLIALNTVHPKQPKQY